jgi:ferredoxin
MRITTDPERCVGAGQCVLAAPDVFDQREDGTVLLLAPAPDAGKREPAREAAARCPSLAITLHDG